MNSKEYFSALGKKSWQARKKTMNKADRVELAKKGQKGLKKKIKEMSNILDRPAV